MDPKVVPFQKPAILEIEGNVYKDAMVLGDVDNDGFNELIVGTVAGNLGIFKGIHPRPLRLATDIGIICVVCVGDLLNIGRNVLMIITAYGTCNIYDFDKDVLNLREERKEELVPIHSQRLPANVRSAVIGDVNGDGANEIALALTDRVVRTYKWVSCVTKPGNVPKGKLIGQSKWELSDQIGGIALNPNEGHNPSLLVSQPGASVFTLNLPRDSEVDEDFEGKSCNRLNKMSAEFDCLDNNGYCNSKIQTEICGDIELDTEASFDHFKAVSSAPMSASSFFGSDTYCDLPGYVLATVDGVVMLYRDKKMLWKVSLGYPIISVSQLRVPVPKKKGMSDEFRRAGTAANSTCHPDRREVTPTSKVPYGVVKSPSKSIPIATPSTPGIEHDPMASDSYSQAKYFPRIKREGGIIPFVSKIVVCSPNGHTFIMNVIDGSYVMFEFREKVNSFITGFFGNNGINNPSIVYSNFNDRIYVYFEVNKSLKHNPRLADLQRNDLKFLKALKLLDIDIDNKETMRQLNRFLMHGFTDIKNFNVANSNVEAFENIMFLNYN